MATSDGTPRPIAGSPHATKVVIALSLVLLLQFIAQQISAMFSDNRSKLLLAFASVGVGRGALAQSVDVTWHAPSQSQINNLTQVLSGSGVYGFIYNTSVTPDAQYGTYNWCNMPHARSREYKKASSEYELRYVELVSAVQPLYLRPWWGGQLNEPADREFRS